MPADVVDLLSSSPTAPKLGPERVEKAVNPAQDGAYKGKSTVRMEEIEELPSSWPTSSDIGGLVITRNLDLGGERSPKRRKLQQLDTSLKSRVTDVKSLSGVKDGQRARRTIELDALSDSDPFASSPTGVQMGSKAPAERSPSPGSRPDAAASNGLKKRTSPQKIPSEMDPFSSSFPDIDVLPNRVAVSASRASKPTTRVTRASAEILSSPTFPAVEDILAEAPKIAASGPPKKSVTERVPSPNPFSSSPLPDITAKKPQKEATKPEVCRISSSPEAAPRSRTRTPPTKETRFQNPASDPFASSPISGLPRQASAATVLRPSEARPTRKPASRQPRDFDPISSSAPEPSKTPNPPKKRVITINESDSDHGKSSDDDLPSLADLRNLKPRASTSFQRSRSDTYASNSKVTNRTTATAATTTAKSKQSAEEKERLRLEKQRTKEADKEAKKVAAEQKKQVAALEKAKSAALAEVNKLKTDKKDSTQEMIVDLPSGLDEGLRISAQTVLEGLEPAPQHTVYESQIPNVVKFRRKINSRYDEALRYWVPCPAKIEDEGHVLVVIDADEFVKLAQDGLDDFVSLVEAMFPDAIKVYLLQGIATWKKKNRALKNRQFASGVRGEPEISSSSRRRKTPAKEPIDEDIVEDAMLQLQVEHSALIHHTTTPPDTASWISTFTQHISTIPYRHRRDADLRTANFCMESGQVKTGENPRDTYVKMLGEIGRVTDGIAYGVAEEFPSVGRLVRGLEREGGMEKLGEVRKASNRNGAFSDMRIGGAMGRRFWHIFTGRDEESTDV